MYAHMYDSAVWKRICRIHDYMQPHVQFTLDGLNWTADSSGQFTCKSAYSLLSSVLTSFDYSRYIWWPGSPSGTRIFLWKFWHRSLPLVDILRVWQIIFPSQCVFCRINSDRQDHIFLHCPVIQPLWQEISILLSSLMPRQSTICACLLHWWRISSSHTMIGQLRVVVPSLVAWVN